jgi:WD40 repeat protein
VSEQLIKSPQSRWLAIALFFAIIIGSVFLLRSNSPRLTFILRHLLPAGFPGAMPLMFSPDSQLLAIAGTEGVNVWRVTDGQIIHAFPIAFLVRGLSLAFSPDGKLLAVGCTDDAVRIYNIADGKLKKVLGETYLVDGERCQGYCFFT